MRSVVVCLAILLALGLAGCGSGTSRSGAGGGSGGGKSAAEARAELMATAKKMEGGMWEAVKGYVEAVESGTWSWGTADENFAPGKFTPETVAAYKRWRAARIAETKK